MSASASSRIAHVPFRLPRVPIAFCLLLLLLCLASAAVARQSETRHPHMRRVDGLADTEYLIPRARYADAAPDNGLRRRAYEDLKDSDDKTETSEKHAKKTEDDDATTTKTSHHTKISTATKVKASVTTMTFSVSEATSTAGATSSPLPEAFDGNIAAELDSDSSSNCPTFLEGVLNDPSFKTCYPLSMMLQTSSGFFNAQKQLLSVVRVLDATCAANVTYCTEFFDGAASNLTAVENCKSEWESGDNTVKQFLLGLKAYEMMYQATCLQDPDSDMYCYANAVTNRTSAANAYFYYLPYNLTLPGSTVPACNWCNQETMAIFHTAAADRSQYIGNTYESAAQQVNTICGLDFVNSTLPKEVSSSSLSTPSWSVVTASLLGAALINILL